MLRTRGDLAIAGDPNLASHLELILDDLESIRSHLELILDDLELIRSHLELIPDDLELVQCTPELILDDIPLTLGRALGGVITVHSGGGLDNGIQVIAFRGIAAFRDFRQDNAR